MPPPSSARAVDALVTTSADLLDRVGTRFADQVEAETGKLEARWRRRSPAARSKWPAWATRSVRALRLFGQSNEALMERLQQIAAALDTSLTRSDEQLAYYVAQAREVIDLSMLSQKQIIEDMQQLAAPAGGCRSRAGMSDEIEFEAESVVPDLGRLRRPDVGAAGRVRADPGRRDRRAAAALAQAGRGSQAAPGRGAAPHDAGAGAGGAAGGRPRDPGQWAHRHSRQRAVRAELRPAAAGRAARC